MFKMTKCKSCGEKLEGLIRKRCGNPKCSDYYCPNMGMNGLGGGFSKIKASKNKNKVGDASRKNQKAAKNILSKYSESITCDTIDNENIDAVSGSIDYVPYIPITEIEEDMFCMHGLSPSVWTDIKYYIIQEISSNTTTIQSINDITTTRSSESFCDVIRISYLLKNGYTKTKSIALEKTIGDHKMDDTLPELVSIIVKQFKGE